MGNVVVKGHFLVKLSVGFLVGNPLNPVITSGSKFLLHTLSMVYKGQTLRDGRQICFSGTEVLARICRAAQHSRLSPRVVALSCPRPTDRPTDSEVNLFYEGQTRERKLAPSTADGPRPPRPAAVSRRWFSGMWIMTRKEGRRKEKWAGLVWT